MIRKIAKSYKSALKNLFFTSIILFVSCCLIIFYLKLWFDTNKFIEIVEKNKSSIELDFRRLQLYYKSQISFVKNKIEPIIDNPKKVQEFLTSQEMLLIDRSRINVIIITDENFKIRTLDQNQLLEHSITIENRDYLKIIKKSPDLIILGDVVEGVITKKPAIPLATGLKDKHGKMNGALIFSVNLASLQKSLLGCALVKVLIENDDNNARNGKIYEDLKNSPKAFFISNVLYPGSTNIGLINPIDLMHKPIYLEYDITELRNQFMQELGTYYITLGILFAIIDLLIYCYMLYPIRSVMFVLDKVVDKESTGISIFNQLTNLVILQSEKISAQKLLQKQQQMHLMAIMSLSKYSVNSISENLVDDIDELVTGQNKTFLSQYKELVQEIQQKLVNSESDIQASLDVGTEIFDLVMNNPKEVTNFFSLLIEGGVSAALIAEQGQYNEDSKFLATPINQAVRQSSLGILIYKKLFYKLIQEILQSQNENNVLTRVNIMANNIDFIFTHYGSGSLAGFKINLIRCKILGVFNNVKIKCLFEVEQIIIRCTIIDLPSQLKEGDS